MSSVLNIKNSNTSIIRRSNLIKMDDYARDLFGMAKNMNYRRKH